MSPAAVHGASGGAVARRVSEVPSCGDQTEDGVGGSHQTGAAAGYVGTYCAHIHVCTCIIVAS